MGLRGIGVVGLVMLVAGLVGCCNCGEPPGGVVGKFPAPLTLDAQVRALNSRARLIPLLRAKAKTAGVQIKYRDDHGREHNELVEGTLLIRQHFWDEPGSEAGGGGAGDDVLLIGRSFENQVFQAGRNAKEWWFAVFVDPKTAWTGPVNAGMSVGNPGQASVLRADLVPELLAITEIAPGYGESIAMRVNDERGTNDILIFGYRADRTGWIKREIIVDRRTGDVKETGIYDASGLRVVRATLSDYAGAPRLAEGGDAQIWPRLPRKVRIDYPAEQMTIRLEFEQVEIPVTLREDMFDTLDFSGLRVVRVE